MDYINPATIWPARKYIEHKWVTICDDDGGGKCCIVCGIPYDEWMASIKHTSLMDHDCQAEQQRNEES